VGWAARAYLKHAWTRHHYTRPAVIKVLHALKVADVLEDKRVRHRVLPPYPAHPNNGSAAYQQRWQMVAKYHRLIYGQRYVVSSLLGIRTIMALAATNTS
jgi:hypothetical protein